MHIITNKFRLPLVEFTLIEALKLKDLGYWLKFEFNVCKNNLMHSKKIGVFKIQRAVTAVLCTLLGNTRAFSIALDITVVSRW